jgi:hypothetical protein
MNPSVEMAEDLRKPRGLFSSLPFNDPGRLGSFLFKSRWRGRRSLPFSRSRWAGRIPGWRWIGWRRKNFFLLQGKGKTADRRLGDRIGLRCSYPGDIFLLNGRLGKRTFHPFGQGLLMYGGLFWWSMGGRVSGKLWSPWSLDRKRRFLFRKNKMLIGQGRRR